MILNLFLSILFSHSKNWCSSGMLLNYMVDELSVAIDFAWIAWAVERMVRILVF
jgi:hypothetical protein